LQVYVLLFVCICNKAITERVKTKFRTSAIRGRCKPEGSYLFWKSLVSRNSERFSY